MNPNALPTRPAQRGGLRVARWIRESTPGQADKYGPGAQRRMQDKASVEFGFVDTGLEWTVLRSGWSGADSMKEPPATQTPDFRAMVRAAEEGRFDVLLVGYTSRFLRDLTLALNYRRHFQLNGVVIWMCDDRILTSNPLDWERFVDKVKAAEVYSRDHSRNVRSGYEEKRAVVGDPGGHPPFGFRRVDKLLEVDPKSMPVVHRMYTLAAAGRTDREVSDLTGQSLLTVRHVVRNQIYIGRLRDGGTFRLGAQIDLATWNDVQARREQRRTRLPGRVVIRSYALKVRCASCQLPLHGDTQRYRHPEPVCVRFAEAKPLVTAVRGRHGTSEGKSYRQDWFEGVAERLLAAVAAAPPDLIECVLASLDADDGMPPNDLALARIARQMDAAAHQLTVTRDIDEWRATTARLDAEREAVVAAEPSRTSIDPVVARQYLLDLAGIWRQADPRARQELALALWDGWEFLGFKEATYRWSAAARGYGLDRLVPAELNIELSNFVLPGLPLGGFTLKAAAARDLIDLACEGTA